jgi:hypothetical protein
MHISNPLIALALAGLALGAPVPEKRSALADPTCASYSPLKLPFGIDWSLPY